MTCYHPLDAAWIPGSGLKPVIYKKGRRPKELSGGYEEISLPCGQCIGCRLEKSRQWAARMVHEAQMHDWNCFITLTYDDEHLPYGGSLCKDHIQNFFKKLRREIYPRRIKYYQCGEYGSTCPQHGVEDCYYCGPLQRPHHHAILFGFQFPDKQSIGDRDGQPVYTSELLGHCWPHGLHEIGNVTFESCAYVARYCMKKQTGDKAEDYYQKWDFALGKLIQVEPEYATMSLRPAIGKEWLEEYFDDVYPESELPIPGRGEYGSPPRYYDKVAESEYGLDFTEIKAERIRKAEESLEKGPSLESREKVKKAQVGQLARSI